MTERKNASSSVKPPKCIRGAKKPCPTCPVSKRCAWGQKILIHDPEQLAERIARAKR